MVLSIPLLIFPSGVATCGPLKVKAPPPLPPCSGGISQPVLQDRAADVRLPELVDQVDANAAAGDHSLKGTPGASGWT